MTGRPERLAARRRCAAVVARLDIPVPFTLQEFAGRLQRDNRRVLRLVPAVMEPDGPSGIWTRTAAAGYLYYQQQTSPFHRACIVAQLAAHIALRGDDGASVDLRLLPDVTTELIQLVLGGGAQVTELEAQTFAFLVLERAHLLACPEPVARRLLRELRPLWAALREAVPESGRAAAGGGRPAARSRLYRQVIGIRDAQLVLRPCQDPDVADAAATAARQAGLGGDELDAAVEAAVLAGAARARNAGRPRRRAGATSWPAVRGGADLAGEAAWLARVSQALAASPVVRDLAGGSPPEDPPGHDVRPMGGDRTRGG